MRNTMHTRHVVILAILAVAAVGGTLGTIALNADRTERFPHALHTRMFPLCEGCHEGIETGDVASYYPPPQLCQNCHDGTVEGLVEWTGPSSRLTNLVFEHTAHATAASLECEECHTVAGAPRMTIQRANADACFSCHEGRDHFTDADCRTCHTTFVESELPPSRLASLPLPEDHRLPGFLLEGHGLGAQLNATRCAMCHTQERCTSCHVDVEGVPQIADIPAAPQDWVLPAYAVEYPVPLSHLTPQWIEQHGPFAGRAQCATCHTREDCTTCHVPPGPPVVESFPARTLAQAPGAGTERRMPLSHATRWFDRNHAGVASAQPESCSACHTRTFCTDCHDAPATPGYHPRNFALQHSAAAYSQRLECSTCHEVRTFCRACHVQQGMDAVGRLGPGFHDAEPLWLLRHARAARQGLESCTTCHTQRDCMQCHSQVGAFQVNPHGPNFDARRAYSRNPVICSACHVGDPINGRSRQ